jgi:hypothetical protein
MTHGGPQRQKKERKKEEQSDYCNFVQYTKFATVGIYPKYEWP